MKTVDAVTGLSLESFRLRANTKKLLILYPGTPHRLALLAHMLAWAGQEGYLYYRVKQEAATLKTMLRDLLAEVETTQPALGRPLAAALADDRAEAFGIGLAAGLAAAGVRFGVLDELDRLPHDSAFEEFIQALVAHLPAGVQLVVSARQLNQQPWYRLIAAGSAVVFGTELRQTDGQFALDEQQIDNPRPQLEVYGFGRGRALVNGQPIVNWDGALPRNLFFYFIDHPLTTRDAIFQTFWSNLSIKEATNVFHVTKRKITERISLKLGPGQSCELTHYQMGFYLPSDKIVRHYDVTEFQDAISRGEASSGEDALAHFGRAIALYRGPFLQTIAMPWVEERREALRASMIGALLESGRIWKRRGHWERALGFYVRAVKEAPEREDAQREAIALYILLGRTEDALAQYRFFEQTLDQRFGIGPSAETRALLDQIEQRA